MNKIFKYLGMFILIVIPIYYLALKITGAELKVSNLLFVGASFVVFSAIAEVITNLMRRGAKTKELLNRIAKLYEEQERLRAMIEGETDPEKKSNSEEALRSCNNFIFETFKDLALFWD